MNKKLLCTLSIFLTPITSLLSAELGIAIEVRASAFFHTSERFRAIYGDVGPSYGIEMSKKMDLCLDTWLDCDYFNQCKSQASCCKSEIDILNTSFGLRYSYSLTSCLKPYLGIGPALSWLYFKNKTCCQHENHARLTPGLVVKSGVIYHFKDPYYLNFFVDYIYQPIHFEKTVDIGGIKAGLGLGIQF
jgi:outer membrane protein